MSKTLKGILLLIGWLIAAAVSVLLPLVWMPLYPWNLLLCAVVGSSFPWLVFRWLDS